MEIRADKRSIRAQREPDAERAVTDGLAHLRELQIRLAREFARIEASAHFVFSGCASVIEYAVKRGYSVFEARTLLGLGKTLEAAPDAEARVRSGELSVEAASAVGRILANPEIVAGPEGSAHAGWETSSWRAEEWLEAAATEPFTALKRRIKQHIEMHAQQAHLQGAGLEEVTVLVGARTKDDFLRAQEVAAQKAGKPLSEGQVFHRVVNFYLDKNDPLRAKDGTRRVGPTSERPGDPQDPSTRYIPAAVRRAVWQRAGGTCEVPGCHRRHGLELAHRVPHAEGSAREVEDLGLLCHRHHLLYDAGRIPWPVPGGTWPVGGGSSSTGPPEDDRDPGRLGPGVHGAGVHGASLACEVPPRLVPSCHRVRAAV